jgi:putative peptidoglycan lipid II flippase
MGHILSCVLRRLRAIGLIGAVRTLSARAVPRGAALLSILTFGGYLVGLLRDRIFARTFGAGLELDAYNAAFVLPELTLDVLVASGLAAPFIPIFMRLSTDDEREAHAFAQTILTGAIILMTAAAVALFVFAPQTTGLIAPGFTGAQREQYVDLFRVMLVTPILFAASLTLGEVLLVERRWVAYGIAPLAYNAGIVLGTVALSDRIGIFGAAVGAVIGASLHFGVRVWGLRRSAFRIRFRLRQRMQGVDEFVRLMLPKMVTHPVEPITFLFFTGVASSLAAGSVTAVSFARNFQSVPVSVIGIAFALAAFPSLSAAYAAGDRRAFVGRLTSALLSVAGLTAAAAVALVVVGQLAIELFLGGGAFDAGDVALTAGVLAAFALSVPFESLTHLLSRAIYATRNTLLQVLSSFAALLVTVGATLALVEPIGIIAIPIGFAIGNATKVALLGAAVLIRLRTLPVP